MSEQGSPRFGLGASSQRVEDDALLRGLGRYTADFNAPGQLVAYFLRSDYAAARFRIGDTGTARRMHGVHLIWTGDDVGGEMPIQSKAKVPEGTPFRESRYPLICKDQVRMSGDVVALIVAETLSQAQAAAEAIEIDYDPLPAVADALDALDPDAPLVWPEFQTNVAFEAGMGDSAAVEAGFGAATMTAKVRVRHNRLICNYMEPRAVLAKHDPAADVTTLILPSQGVHVMRWAIAGAMGVPEASLRVQTYDVGGGFGPKYFAYRDYPLLALAARELGRPIKWTCTRMEHFVADAHGRDAIVEAEIAIDDSGRILALRSDWTGNLGAYMSQYGSHIPWVGATMTSGVYDIPATHVTVRCAYTHTTPTDAYRGAGRPEASLTIELLMDEGARVCGLRPEEFRRRNFIRPDQMPYRTATGRLYDSGTFEAQMDAALSAAEYHGFEDRLNDSRSRGMLRGIGFATYIEACAFAGSEPAHVNLMEDGRILLRIGTQASGQGHQTVYGQFLAEEFGVGPEQMVVRQGDTDDLAAGGATAGSRSIPLGVPSVRRASRLLASALRAFAAERFDVAPEDIEFEDGLVRVRGTNHTLSFADLSRQMPPEQRHAMDAFVQSEPTYPNGTHVCEVEIDPQTGLVTPLRLTVVDDFGVVVNPLLLDGQIHGGVAQGLGQALMERAVYDASAQMLSASFMDYAMPRAGDMPDMTLDTMNVPCRWNEMGIKGAGEAGAIGATPAIANAVINALHRGFGIRSLDLPATPERVWRAIQEVSSR